jgi:PilZ domain-containing protein
MEEGEVTDHPADDKPVEPRRSIRVVLQARASYGDGAISTQCTVNELSDVGARINIASSFSLPETFDLAIPQRGIARRAKLIWRRGDQAGVDFVEAEHPQAAVADPTARIKALEAENAKLKAQIGVLLQQVQRLTEV